MTVSSDLATDNRVHRNCTVLEELGYQVFLIGREKKNSPRMPKRSYSFKRLKLLHEKGAFFYAALNIRLVVFLLFKKVDFVLPTILTHFLRPI